MGVTRNTVGHFRLEYRASTIVLSIVTRTELGYTAYIFRETQLKLITSRLYSNTEENESLPTLPCWRLVGWKAEIGENGVPAPGSEALVSNCTTGGLSAQY